MFCVANDRFEPIRLMLQNIKIKIQLLSSGFTLVARETQEEAERKPRPRKKPREPREANEKRDSQGKYLASYVICVLVGWAS